MTAADRKRKEREEKRKAGLVPKEIWVREELWPRIRRYIEQLMKRAG